MGILIAMSGGVDSSVTAYLMKNKYEKCSGATMLLFLNEALGVSSKHPCCSFENIQDAKKICELIDINHEVLNYMPEFEEKVIKKFVDVYESGGTPNPCIDCNKFMKFNLFMNHAKEIGLEKIATGHYAKIEYDNSSKRYLLKKAKDLSRDQSYVLYMLTQEQLANIEFPLGNFLKSEVREIAESQGFINARKSDSQDICFVPDGDYASFIENYTGKKYETGNFIDSTGKILGKHKGLIHYTAGQRRGLGVAAKSRLYVSEINREKNTITLSSGDEENLFFKSVEANNINLIALEKIENYINAKVKIRYRQKEIPAKIFQLNENELHIEFYEPQKTPAIGQSVVIYSEDVVIGGGIITARGNQEKFF